MKKRLALAFLIICLELLAERKLAWPLLANVRFPELIETMEYPRPYVNQRA